MEGIFGVGIAELVIIILVILVVGGPKNTLKWSRDAGRLLRQARDMWQKMIAELEKDLGDDGREIMNATRDLTRNVNEVRNAANPRRIASQATRMIDSAVNEADKEIKSTLKESDEALNKAFRKSNGNDDQPNNERYKAWLPTNDTTQTETTADENSEPSKNEAD